MHTNSLLRLPVLLVVLASSLPAQAVTASPLVVSAPGHIEVRLQRPGEQIHLFASVVGAGGARVVPGIAGTLKLQGTPIYAGLHRGDRRLSFTVPKGAPPGHVWMQALVVGSSGVRFSNVCRVSIAELSIERVKKPRLPQRDDDANVGQEMQLLAKLLPADLVKDSSFQWGVQGGHVRDYVDDMHATWQVYAMRPQDYQQARIGYYWLPDASQVHPRRGAAILRQVRVRVDLADGVWLKAKRTFDVERNGKSIYLQAEDFFCEHNHLLPGGGLGNPPTRVLSQHADWHLKHDWYLVPKCGSQTVLYREFLHHHAHMLVKFDTWRKLFGYSPIVEWDTNTRIPTGVEIDHRGRRSSDPKYPRPGFLTIAGGGEKSPCHKYDKLADFKDVSELSPVCAEPWHFGVHWAVGGDMASTTTSPKDPVFWRFHRFLDNKIHLAWHKLKGR